MPVDSTMNILTLSNTQAKELAGRIVVIDGTTYIFNRYAPAQPGQPPWRSGAEGKAYPLLSYDGAVAAYLKFFTEPTQKRLDRTAWLIGQQMHTWLPHLVAAPALWTDTRRGLRGVRLGFHFAAYLAKAVPGETWLERKGGIASGETCFPDEFRWRSVKDLILALAVLERAEFVHGDLSPNNVVIDLEARPGDPALYLIDFDAFRAPAAERNAAITVAEGGTFGTEGYCPPELATAAAEGDGSVAPYSDRYGRDMLLLELLLMGSGLPADDPVVDWNREQVVRLFAAWQARSDRQHVEVFKHVNPAKVFKLAQSERPTSVDLAIGLGLSLPDRRVLRRVTELPRPTPATIGHSVAPIRPTMAGASGSQVRITDVFKALATRGSVGSGDNERNEQAVFGCGIAVGVPIVAISALIAVASTPSKNATDEEKTQNSFAVMACVVVVAIFLGFVIGYIANRE